MSISRTPPVETIRIDADGPMDDDITRQIRRAIQRARKGTTTQLLDGDSCIAEIIPGSWNLTRDATRLEQSINRVIPETPLDTSERIPAVEGHGYLEKPLERKPTLLQDLETLINSHSGERVSNTPDFILASFLNACLDAFNGCVMRRDQWYRVYLSPGASHFEPGHYSENPKVATDERT